MKKVIAIALLICLLFSINVSAEEIIIPSLMYHNINNNYSHNRGSVEISAERFDEHMKVLKDNGYTAIFFNEYLECLQGKKEFPKKPILITFDDGYLSNYTIGFPILKKHGMKATIFIVTGRMGLQGAVTYPHFTWEQALEMEKSGTIDIQSHTQYHSHLAEISSSSLTLELRKSKYIIEKMLNKKVNILAYPYGEWNDNVILSAKNAGYDACVLADPVDPGVNRIGDNPYLIKRITVYGHMSGKVLLDEIKKNESRD